VQIRYSAYGVPHIKAQTSFGAGYGLGFAFARENLCIGVELALTVAGERSSAFGEDASYVDPHLGATAVRNLDSDFYYRFIYTDEVVASMRRQLSAEARELVAGYVRGFNRYLRDTPAGRRPSSCRAAPWLRPISDEDVYRRINHIAVLESTHGMLSAIAGAEPPSDTGVRRAARTPHSRREVRFASNMAAFGRDTTDNRRGLSFSNPHFPWSGPQRLYAAQLTIPGKYDAFGAMLYGAPFILLGFNKDVAWSITYSTNHRVALYRLTSSADSPTRYVVDGKPRQLLATSLEVPSLNAAGKRVVRRRTLYRTEYGPVIDSAVFPWTREHVYVIKDANRDLGRWPDQFLESARAKRTVDIKRAAERIRGHMFSNVTAADRYGDVLYANYSPAINMPDADVKRCLIETGEKFLREEYTLVFDGARGDCDFRRDGDAIDPQILPARRAPWTMRTDYVLNANDSHWLVNADPTSVLEGFDLVVGPERIARGDRTRTGLRLVERRLAGADGLGGNKMSSDALRRLFYRAETVTGESIQADAVADCRANALVDLPNPGITVDLARACDVLADWDGTAHVTSRGAALAREFMIRLPREVRSAGYVLTSDSWRVPFDRRDPIGTPSGLAASATTRTALAEAVWALDNARLPYEKPFGVVQFLQLDGERVPVGGFPFSFHMMIAQLVPAVGLTRPTTGDSYIHAVTFDERGPIADVVVAYSQSTDSSSPHSSDFSRAYAEERWARVPFLERDIVSNPNFQLIELTP
jgi:acyl-homoserine-lactone acylase